MLDVACGAGRHMRWLAEQGCHVTGLDRDGAALAIAGQWGKVVQVDLENGSPWPLPGRQFGAVIVTNYLWRPLLSRLFGSVQPGGVLLYETFAAGQETIGKPSRPEFLLQPGELLQAAGAAGKDWRVVAFEDGFDTKENRFVQRMVAVRGLHRAGAVPPRHGLNPAPLLAETHQSPLAASACSTNAGAISQP